MTYKSRRPRFVSDCLDGWFERRVAATSVFRHDRSAERVVQAEAHDEVRDVRVADRREGARHYPDGSEELARAGARRGRGEIGVATPPPVTEIAADVESGLAKRRRCNHRRFINRRRHIGRDRGSAHREHRRRVRPSSCASLRARSHRRRRSRPSHQLTTIPNPMIAPAQAQGYNI